MPRKSTRSHMVPYGPAWSHTSHIPQKSVASIANPFPCYGETARWCCLHVLRLLRLCGARESHCDAGSARMSPRAFSSPAYVCPDESRSAAVLEGESGSKRVGGCLSSPRRFSPSQPRAAPIMCSCQIQITSWLSMFGGHHGSSRSCFLPTQ